MRVVPTPEEVLERLEPVTVALRSSLRKGTDRARKFLEGRGEWDPYYAASRTRFEARSLLKQAALDIVSDDDEGASETTYEVGDVSNIGLEFFLGGILAKVLKRTNDPKYPLAPSNSAKRNGFCNQQRQIVRNLRQPEAPLRLSDWNAIYLWDCDEARRFSDLLLVLPRTGGKRKEQITWYWIAKIAVTATGDVDVEYGQYHTQQILIEDVPITLPEADRTAEGNEQR